MMLRPRNPIRNDCGAHLGLVVDNSVDGPHPQRQGCKQGRKFGEQLIGPGPPGTLHKPAGPVGGLQPQSEIADCRSACVRGPEGQNWCGHVRPPAWTCAMNGADRVSTGAWVGLERSTVPGSCAGSDAVGDDAVAGWPCQRFRRKRHAPMGFGQTVCASLGSYSTEGETVHTGTRSRNSLFPQPVTRPGGALSNGWVVDWFIDAVLCRAANRRSCSAPRQVSVNIVGVLPGGEGGNVVVQPLHLQVQSVRGFGGVGQFVEQSGAGTARSYLW